MLVDQTRHLRTLTSFVEYEPGQQAGIILLDLINQICMVLGLKAESTFLSLTQRGHEPMGDPASLLCRTFVVQRRNASQSRYSDWILISVARPPWMDETSVRNVDKVLPDRRSGRVKNQWIAAGGKGECIVLRSVAVAAYPEMIFPRVSLFWEGSLGPVVFDITPSAIAAIHASLTHASHGLESERFFRAGPGLPVPSPVLIGVVLARVRE